MKNVFGKAVIVLMIAALTIACFGCETGSQTEPSTEASTAEQSSSASAPAETEEATTYNITYISRGMSDPFAAWLANSFVAIAEEKYPNIEITKIVDSQDDAATFLNALETAIISKPDGIIFQPVAGAQAAATVQDAVDKGIAIININLAIEESGICSLVLADDYAQGTLVAEEAAKNLPENAKVVILNGIAGIVPTVERRRAYDDLLAERTDIELLDEQTADYSKDLAMNKMEDWLQKFPQIDGVLAANDGMALGAIEAYKSSNKDLSNVQFYGIDGLADACLSIKAGEETASVLQDANDYAVKTLDLMQKTLAGEVTEPVVIESLPLLITMDNVDDIIQMHKDNGLLE